MTLHDKTNTVWTGAPVEDAARALIMVHGRGAGAHDILSLAHYLPLDDFAIAVPQATNHQWYPYSFMEKMEHNEPWLSSAITLLETLVQEISSKGIAPAQIYLLGFSQGACLTLEFAARHAQLLGGIAAFTGGLIGDSIHEENYHGDFEQTPVFLSTGNPDPHVPVQRVMDSAEILRSMNANVHLKVYNSRPHTISEDELTQANNIIFMSGRKN